MIRFLKIAILISFLLSPVNSARADVILKYFKATSQSDGILLEWETSSEPDSSGFYILRSTKPDVNYTRLNIFILSDSETGEGVYYSYLDDEVLPGTVYYYKLEAIALNGSREIFGPVSAGNLIQTPTPTNTSTHASTDNKKTATPSSTPTHGVTSALQGTPTPTRTMIPMTLTQIASPTPTVTEAGTPAPTTTPTLEPLPSIEFLFPAPAATRLVSPTSRPQISSIDQGLKPLTRPKLLSPRYMILLGIILLLWACLLVFMILLIRKIFHNIVDVEGID